MMEGDPFLIGAIGLSQGLAAESFSPAKQEYIVTFCEQVEAHRKKHGHPTDAKGIQAERQFAFDSLPSHAHSIIHSWIAISTKVFESGGDGESTPFDVDDLGRF